MLTTSRFYICTGRASFPSPEAPDISIYVFNQLRTRTERGLVTDVVPGNANPTWAMEILYGKAQMLIRPSVGSGRADKGDGLSFILAINAEVRFIDGDNGMMGIEFTHPHQAQVGQVRLAIRVPAR